MKLAGHDNRLAGLLATANSTATGYPTDNLQDRLLWSYTQTVAGTFTLELSWDAGAAVAWPYIAAFGHNLLDDATIRVRASANSGHSPTVYDSGTIAAFNLSRPRPVDVRPSWGWPILHFPDPVPTARYLRVTLADPSRSSGSVRLAHVLAGELLDLHARPALVNEVAPGAAGLREWLLSGLVSEHEADQLRVLHEWSQRTGGRFILVPRPDESDSWQYQVLWCVAAEERFETPWRSGGLATAAKVDFRMPLREVAY